MSQLSENLRYFRKKSQLTQKQVADVLGIERSAYSYYETGKTRPKLKTLQNLARLFNTNVNLLLGDYKGNDGEGIVSSPNLFESRDLGETLNQLSDFEQEILLRVRIMSVSEKKKLMEYLKSDEFH